MQVAAFTMAMPMAVSPHTSHDTCVTLSETNRHVDCALRRPKASAETLTSLVKILSCACPT